MQYKEALLLLLNIIIIKSHAIKNSMTFVSFVTVVAVNK